MKSKSYLIVGGSSGIGLDVVHLMASVDADVHVISRRVGPLAEVKSIQHISSDVVHEDFPVEGFTRSLAAELAPKIRVNAIAPSLTDTPLTAALLDSESRRKASAQRHPMKRIGTPRDIAAAVRFLLRPDASWVTGQIIPVDGGMGALRLFP